MTSFNPLFIRSVFLFKFTHYELVGESIWFQSLIHQVSVSFTLFSLSLSENSTEFQSLIHQVSVSFQAPLASEADRGK